MRARPTPRGRHRRRHRRRASSTSVATTSPTGIPTERVVEIQSALIKLGYLEGPASGQYDASTITAMKEFQSDNGLQRSGLPSAATLKRLGVSKRSNDGYSVPVKSSGGGGAEQQSGSP
ncbi:MAG TPA: peptidoglycan-binding domain-containing protein [Blastocatellia bacterium]|nr:peptidoglycan-binding domain-containing protein [Blastocatellia bacterium]